MGKRILSLDLGITSIGYSILEENEKNRYALIDYGVSMFDRATDKDGKSKKLLHTRSKTASNLHQLRKQRVQNLAILFESYGLKKKESLLEQEQENRYSNKWYLRGEKAYKECLSTSELFAVFYLIAKHRGYKSLNNDDLMNEFLKELNFEEDKKKKTKDVKTDSLHQVFHDIDTLKEKHKHKSLARIIYELEMKKASPTFRNHEGYDYLLRREDIREELGYLVEAQEKFGFFPIGCDVKSFLAELLATIDDQRDVTNDRSLFGNCEYYPEYKVTHQYSLLSDIFKMYQSVADMRINGEALNQIQMHKIWKDFFYKISLGKNITDIKYYEIREILGLEEREKIFGKNDFMIDPLSGKKQHYTIIQFSFLSQLSKIHSSFVEDILKHEKKYDILHEISDILQFERMPKSIYKKIEVIFKTYRIVNHKKIRNEVILALIFGKSGVSMRVSAYAMKTFIPLFEKGLPLHHIKHKLRLKQTEDYSAYQKGLKHLHVHTFEKDEQLEISNHPVKYAVSAAIRVVKHLHTKYGLFDEIRVESTRELSQNEEVKKAIARAQLKHEKLQEEVLQNTAFEKVALEHHKDIRKYTRKILLWNEQNRMDIYSGKPITLEDIFQHKVQVEKIVPTQLGGLNVKHNFVLVSKALRHHYHNALPMQYVKSTLTYRDRVQRLFDEGKINWKKKCNLLAESLDDAVEDKFESKSLRATSYIESLMAQMLKRYYPFKSKVKQRDGKAVFHIQGRATYQLRQILGVKSKVRDSNIHHAIDAILIGMINQSWLRSLSRAFRENIGLDEQKAQAKIKNVLPLIEGVGPAEIIALIEEKYSMYGENSVFYQDIFGNMRSINFWVSKKPTSSKLHKDTIYSKKSDGFFTIREDITQKFRDLKVSIETSSENFELLFKKKILNKLYVYRINPRDVICKTLEERAVELKILLDSFVNIDRSNTEDAFIATEKLETLINEELRDNNNNVIKRVKFFYKNITGFNIRGGLAAREKTFIGFKVSFGKKHLNCDRIDMGNIRQAKQKNDATFKVYKNEIIFFVYKNGLVKGGRVVSLLDDLKLASFSNPRFPASVRFQPEEFYTLFNGRPHSHKQHSIAGAIGVLKVNLDIVGQVKSYCRFGDIDTEVEDAILRKDKGAYTKVYA